MCVRKHRPEIYFVDLVYEGIYNIFKEMVHNLCFIFQNMPFI